MRIIAHRMTRLTLALLAALGVVASLALPGPAAAQESEIKILEHRVETNFPTDVKFYVEVAGPDEIEEVRVVMKTIGQVTRSAYRQVEFEPGVSISGEAELLTGGTNYVPPGTRMAYSFEVRDKGGRLLRTDEEVFVYLDSRFEWFTVSEGIVTVYYNNQLVKSRAEHVLETALTSMAVTGPLLGIAPELPLHIVTYHNYQDMVGALPFRSQATRQQLITQGMAFDEERVLMVHSGDSSVTNTTAHEFVHLLVGDALGRAYSRAPAWLNEGLAEYGARHDDRERDIMNGYLERAIREGDVRPLWHLGSYSGTPSDIVYAYAHGESVVTFMVLEYGEGKMTELMRTLTRTLDIDAALMQVYGFDQYGLDSAWREAIGLEPLPRPEEAQNHPLLRDLPQATIAPVLAPTFAPPAVTPATPPEAVAPATEQQPTPAPPVAGEPAAEEPAVLEPSVAEPAQPAGQEPEPELESESEPTSGSPTESPASGFSPTGIQAIIVVLAFLVILLGALAGVLVVWRGRA